MTVGTLIHLITLSYAVDLDHYNNHDIYNLTNFNKGPFVWKCDAFGKSTRQIMVPARS